LFLEKEDKIKVVEVEVEEKIDDEDGVCFDYPVLKQFFGGALTGRSLFQIERANSEPYGANLHFRDDFLNDGSKQNILVNKVTNGKSGHDWRGPLVFMKTIHMPGHFGSMDPAYIDIELRDVKSIICFFKRYGANI
jgi:hypothetical protein